jgi:hypothetical protein
VEIFLGSHNTSRNKRFTKRSTTERGRTTGRKGKTQEREEQNANHKEHIINRIPKDTRRLGLPFPAAIFGSYTNSPICGPLSQETLRGWENKGRKKGKKIKEVREMGALSSYLTRLLHIFSFALRYFESNHIIRERYGPARGNPTTTTPFMR